MYIHIYILYGGGGKNNHVLFPRYFLFFGYNCNHDNRYSFVRPR